VLRVGVIGLGVGEKHAEGWDRHPDCEVVAICDFDPLRLEDVGARFPVAVRHDRAEDLLASDLDAVSIASYDSHHFEQVRTALGRGLHVFVEKPLCTTSEEAAELRALREAHPHLRLSSNLPLRRSPRFLDLRERIRSGELGRLYYAELDYEYGRLWKITEGWRGREPFYSVMLGGGVHMVDLLLWLTGSRVATVSATASNRIVSEGTQFAFDDLVVTLLEMENGMVAKVAANFGCVHPHFHAVKVFGTGGTFVNGLPDATLWTGDRRDPRPETLDTAYPGVHKGDLIHSFAEAILHGSQPEVTEDDVFHTLDVLFAIERAHRTKAPTSLNPR
jgi:predicted dehydrogenase